MGKGREGEGLEWDGRIQMKTVRIKAAAKWSGKLSVPGLHRIVSPRGDEGKLGRHGTR